MKPSTVTHDIADEFTFKDGKASVIQTNFATKVRKGDNAVRIKVLAFSCQSSSHNNLQSTRLVFETTDHQTLAHASHPSKVDGKLAKFAVPGNMEGYTIKSITSQGKPGSSNAELQKTLTVLYALQKRIPFLSDNPWLQRLWPSFRASSESSPEANDWGNLPDNAHDPWSTNTANATRSAPSVDILSSDSRTHPSRDKNSASERTKFIPLSSPPVSYKGPLNDSQTQAVQSMLAHTSDTDVTIIQGPPGTGKTSVIAAFVSSILEGSNRAVWLMAQSNVAVKNIAEKLVNSDIFGWKLITSTEFYDGWYYFRNLFLGHADAFVHARHEHLYSKLPAENLIRSNELSVREFQGRRVILCTLSMLSNRSIGPIIKANPLETLVIDEASQIQIGDYIPVLSKHGKSIRKICFIGDDKQCERLFDLPSRVYGASCLNFLVPPFGQENINTLQSVFEKEHLRKTALFLDIQCKSNMSCIV